MFLGSDSLTGSTGLQSNSLGELLPRRPAAWLLKALYCSIIDWVQQPATLCLPAGLG